jgi:hypothetical protein
MTTKAAPDTARPGFPAGNMSVPQIFRLPADTDLDRPDS